MPTLILTPRFTEDTQALWQAAGRLGWQVERLGSWRIPDHLKTVEEPVLYSEALFGPALGEQLGLLLTNPPDDWLVQVPLEFRRRNIELTTLGEARAHAGPAFIKPPNDKSFPAKVYTGSELPHEYEESMPVLVSDVVHWVNEFRCFILDRQLLTFSVYARDGDLQREQGFAHTEDEALELVKFVNELLRDERISLPRATVVDVGVIAGKGWAVVEQNAAWGAGIYACNPDRCLEVIRHASKELE